MSRGERERRPGGGSARGWPPPDSFPTSLPSSIMPSNLCFYDDSLTPAQHRKLDHLSCEPAAASPSTLRPTEPPPHFLKSLFPSSSLAWNSRPPWSPPASPGPESSLASPRPGFAQHTLRPTRRRLIERQPDLRFQARLGIGQAFPGCASRARPRVLLPAALLQTEGLAEGPRGLDEHMPRPRMDGSVPGHCAPSVAAGARAAGERTLGSPTLSRRDGPRQ